MNLFNQLIANPSLLEQADYKASVLDIATRYPYCDLARFLAVKAGVMPFAEVADALSYIPYPTILLDKISEPANLASDIYISTQTRSQNADNEDLCAPFLEQDDTLVSETLASIMAAQGEKERAKEIYVKLSLKNPEKSSYFAFLIEDLYR